MKEYSIDRLSEDDIFNGKIIAPLKQRLLAQGKSVAEYDYNANIAIITHYLQNKGFPEEKQYEEKAKSLISDFYRATHTEIEENAEIDFKKAEALFDVVQKTPFYKINTDNNSFTFIDLFAGIGGFRIALEQLGGRCVYASEFDTLAQKSYGINYGVIPFGDIKKRENKDIIPEGIDILCAGFPCQPFSMAGLRQGFSDEAKGTLFFDLRDIIKEKRPRIILLENVPGLLSIYNIDEDGNTKVKTIDNILNILRDELKYFVPEPEIINARHFGVPQNRNRVFIVGFRDKDATNYVYPRGENIPEKHFGDIREKGIVDSKYYMSLRYWNTLVRHKDVQHVKGRGFGYRIISDDDFGHTLMVGGMGLERNLVKDPSNPNVNIVSDPRGELNHDNIRVLTERECARMQGFPDDFKICVGKSPAYRQFGNSVAIPAVKEVARSLLEFCSINYTAEK